MKAFLSSSMSVYSMFNVMDQDKNGVIIKSEFERTLNQAKDIKTLESVSLQFESLDTDKDGLLTKSELVAFWPKDMKNVDLDALKA
jgi:Ca2+-binding EF-hand superfamily protein